MKENSSELKIVFLGDSGVGKTSILSFFVSGNKLESSNPTIGAAYVSKTINCNGIPVDLMIWDTAGQEMYRGLAPMYYRNASIAVIVFDLTLASTFNSVNYWITELKKNIGEEINLIICGNKLDLAEERAISFEIIEEIEKKNNSLYIETSAFTGVGIERMFQLAVDSVLKKIKLKNSENDKLKLNQNLKNKKSCC